MNTIRQNLESLVASYKHEAESSGISPSPGVFDILEDLQQILDADQTEEQPPILSTIGIQTQPSQHSP
jgi:hypothetical protein